MLTSDFENKLIAAKYVLLKVERLYNSRTSYSNVALYNYLHEAIECALENQNPLP